MNFETAIRSINDDFCNVYFAEYMKEQWGITVGYDTIPPYLALMRKQLADWQLANDCGCSQCGTSGDQPIIVRGYAALDNSGLCILNPPLLARGRRFGPYNVNQMLVASFYR